MSKFKDYIEDLHEDISRKKPETKSDEGFKYAVRLIYTEYKRLEDNEYLLPSYDRSIMND